MLWWNALLPAWNPIELLYNATVGSGPGAMRLTPAPAPRRFSQFFGGAFGFACGLAVAAGPGWVAYVLEGVFLVALGLLAFAGLCLGSFVYHLITGRIVFALRTLPWGPGEKGTDRPDIPG